MKKIARILRTVRYLKWTQVAHQLKNRLKKPKVLLAYDGSYAQVKNLAFFDVGEAHDSVFWKEGTYDVCFLNLEQQFVSLPDWNFSAFGKLWNYNLQYLDYLKQANLPTKNKLELIHSLYGALNNGLLKLEPYPASLRIMNMIRFVSTHEIDETEKEKLNTYIKAESSYLNQNLEYHLLANHLLENLFAMNMSATYFQNQLSAEKYGKLMREQLDEQILKDGAHYEISPMYHKIIFFRVLELFHVLPENSSLKSYLKSKLSLMLNWLEQISFSNGDVPDFNDSTKGITFSNDYFTNVCKELGVESSRRALSDSGYRKFSVSGLECVVDVNGIAPSYQPGHAHADTFSFCMSFEGTPLIVDPGISTYNIGKRRDWERSTLAHNTVSVNSLDSAEVWSGFRVGRRLQVSIENESATCISATHNGYRKLKVNHRRKIDLVDRGITIFDELLGAKVNSAVSNIHLHPDVDVKLMENNTVILNGQIACSFDSGNLSIVEYEYCEGYNKLKTAKKMQVVLTEKKLKLHVRIL